MKLGTGTVSASPSQINYDIGQSVILTATPGRYYTFLKWSDGATNNPRTITIALTNSYTAIFTNTVPLERVLVEQWQNCYGGGDEDDLYCYRSTSDGGWLLGGFSKSGISGNKTKAGFGAGDFWLVRMDADGNKLWDQCYGGSGVDILISLQPTSDGGYLLSGFSESGVSGNKASAGFGAQDGWLVKVDANGTKLWDRCYGGNGSDRLGLIQPTSDGGFLLGGDSDSGVSGNKTSAGFGALDYWLVKVDADGNKIWEQSFGGNLEDQPGCLQPAGDGGWFLGIGSDSGISGNKTEAGFGGRDYWLVKLDSNGNRLWDRYYGGNSGDYLGFIRPAGDGGWLLGGGSESQVSGNKTSPCFGSGQDYWLVKVDANWNKLWDRSYGGTRTEMLASLEPTSDGCWLLPGLSLSGADGNKTSAGPGNNLNHWLLKVDANGNKLWEMSYGCNGLVLRGGLQPASDGGWLLGSVAFSGISGNKTKAGFGGLDYWVIKFAEIERPVGAPQPTAPSVSMQPQSQAVTVGSSVTFSVTADGTAPLGFQWRKNGANIASATGPTLTLNSVQMADAGSYDVVVSNSTGSATSSAATLTVTQPQPPSITTQPQSQTIAAGTTVTLSVAVATTVPLGYQWRFSNVDLAGATNATLTLSNARPANVGTYSVTVRNAFGSVTSSNAVLTIDSNSQVSFPDPKLEAAVRSALAQPAGAITVSKMLALTEFWQPANQGIINLTGLEWAANLTYLSVEQNRITDATPVAGLTNLTQLQLNGNALTNIAAVSGLTKLTTLAAYSNALSDATPLAGLTNLTQLYLDNNRLTNLSALSGLTRLTDLGLARNQLSNVAPLASLTSLTNLYLNGNAVTNIAALSGLTKLTILGLYDNPIRDVTPLAGLTNLTDLLANGTLLSDVTILARLTRLRVLYLASNSVRDVTPLSGLVRLTVLNLAGNWISDLSPLSGLTNLTTLGLNGNRLTNIAPLAGLTKLTELSLESDAISDLAPLAGLTNLANLYLSGNWLTNLTALSGLTKLASLDVKENFLDVRAGTPARTVINTLTSRGVAVTYQPQSTGPKISPMADQTVSVGTSTAPIAFRVADDATPAGNLRITVRASDADLVPAAGMILGGSGANRTLTLTPAAGQTGAANITLMVSDGTASAETSFGLTVLPPQTLMLGQLGAGTISASPSQTNYHYGQTVTLTATPGRYYTFLKWSDSATNNPRSITIGLTNRYTAVFANTVPLETLVFNGFTREAPVGMPVVLVSNQGNSNGPPALASTNFLGGAGDQRGTAVSLANGALYVAADANENSGAANSALIAKYALPLASTPAWTRTFASGCVLFGLAAGADGLYGVGRSYLLTTDASAGKEEKGIAAKFRLDGSNGPGPEGTLWVSGSGGTNTRSSFFRYDGSELFDAVALARENGLPVLYAAGRGQPCSQQSYLVAKFDADGNRLAAATDSSVNVRFSDCYVPSAGGSAARAATVAGISVVIGGESSWELEGDYAQTSGLSGRPTLWFYTTNLTLISRQRDTNTAGSFLGVTSAGSAIFAAGSSYIPGVAKGDNFLIQKFDISGTRLWSKSWGGSEMDGLTGVAAVGARLFACGYTKSSGAGAKDGVLFELDPATGETLSTNLFGGALDDQFNGIATDGTDLYLVGETKSLAVGGNAAGQNDGVLLRYTLGPAPGSVTGLYKPTSRFSFGAANCVQVTIQSSFTNATIFYSLDGSDPSGGVQYTGPFTVTQPTPPQSVTIRAVAYNATFTDSQEADPVVIDPTYSLTVTAPGGAVAVDPPNGPYQANATVTLTATSAAGWTFMKWAGDVSGTNTAIRITMDQPKSVQAVFGTALTTSVLGSGSITLNPSQGPFAYGSTVRLSALPNAGNFFRFWGGSASGNSTSPLDFVVTNMNPTISAVFAALPANTFFLAILIEGDGAVARSPLSNYYTNGVTVTLTASPGLGSSFAGWSGAASGSENPLSVTLRSNQTVSASFRTGGTAAPTITRQPRSQTVKQGSSATFSVVAAGAAPLSYQWRKSGVNLPGATNATLNLNNVLTADAGDYDVVVSNSAGNVSSSRAQLSVLVLSPLIDPVVVTTLAGSGVAGYLDGQGPEARFDSPNDPGVAPEGAIYVADAFNHRIRRISPEGLVTTMAGAGIAGYRDGPATNAQFNLPLGLCVGAGGDIFVADTENNRIRKVSPYAFRTVSTVAGSGLPGYADGSANLAQFNFPNDLVQDASGNLYLSEFNNHTIRRIAPSGTVSTVAGNGVAGYADGAGPSARFNHPGGLAIDQDGNLYVAEWGNQRIRKIALDGKVSTLAGSGDAGLVDGVGTAARFNEPDDMAVDAGGNLFVVEHGNHTVRKISREGVVSTLAGSGEPGFADGPGREAKFSSPSGLGIDGAGNLIVADTGNHLIRKIRFVGPPEILSPPQGQSVAAREAVRMKVIARGAEPLSYQWRKNGANLLGATNATLSLNNVQPADAGDYDVVVSNSVGSVTSNAATLRFSQPSQTITFAALPNRTFGDAPFALSATASSGLAVTFSVLSGPARLTNNVVYLAGSGTVTIRASQSGNASSGAADPVDQSFLVSPPAAQRLSTSQGVAVTFTPVATEALDLQYAIRTPPSGGTALVSKNAITYAPKPVFYGHDTFAYDVTDPVSGTVTPVTVNITVNSVAPVFRLAQANYDVNEESGVVNLTVVRNPSIAATVEYITLRGTAVEVISGSGDYTHTTGTLSFGSGETNRVVSIPINDDQMVEPDEFFSFRIYSPSSGTIGSPDTAVIRIIDNDAAKGNLIFTDIRYPNPRPLSVGRLRLDVLPPDSVGLWRFIGQYDWHASGETIGGLPDGTYSVEFSGAAGGYVQPAPLEVSVSGGALVSKNVYYIGTTPKTGGLIVTLSPAVVANAPVITQRGQWRRKGESAWRDSGSVQTNLNEGAHVLEFKPVDGYAKPPDLTVNVAAKTSSAYSATYVASVTASGLPPTVVPANSIDLTTFPYAFSGQISTEAGLGSGFVVKERVVLTAAHVLFDDGKFDFVKQVRWYFQRYRGIYEPLAEKPRGWYVSDNYSSLRKLENTPGVSSPRVKNLDVATLYFSAAAGRGGFGGYLASDADNNEWLVAGATGSRAKILCGYPVDIVPTADQGKLHATAVNLFDFTQVFQRVYKTTEIKSYGGNSGGPLCVEHKGRYYPAAIYLGGSGQLDVRAIDSWVVDLINRAEMSANGGANNTSGGVITFESALGDTVTGFGHLTVQMEPTAAVDAGSGWRIVGGDPAFVRSAVATTPLVDGDYHLEFADASGYVKPPISPVQIITGTNTLFQARYELKNKVTLVLDLVQGLRLEGSKGSSFRIETKTSLDPSQSWGPFATITLTNEVQTVPGFQWQATGTRFFRAVLITP